MGVFPKKSCYTNKQAQPPNPNKYRVVMTERYTNSTLVIIDYVGCSNFEGRKVMVYSGNFNPVGSVDPHFSATGVSPIARFKPDEIGLKLARKLCSDL